MYEIPVAQGVLLVDCKYSNYDYDRFHIYLIEWEVGITIPKCVWHNLLLYEKDKARSQMRYRHDAQPEYIHEYIFRYLCEFADPYN